MAHTAPLIPNLQWYAEVSDHRAVPVRCPYATVKACPRYYQSLSLLGEAGSTAIPKDEDARLLQFWQRSDLWPRTMEQATSVSGPEGSPFSFSSFCPEVLFARFGFFATYLARYSDEVDRDFAHKQLSAEHAPPGHPRWQWQSAEHQHYTECPVYSVLVQRGAQHNMESQGGEPSWWRKHVAEIVTAIAVAGIGVLAKCAG